MNKVSVEDIFKTNLMALESLSRELETQVSGIVVLVDLKGFVMKRHYKLLSPYFAKKSIDLIQVIKPIFCYSNCIILSIRRPSNLTSRNPWYTQ